ncbi:MAG TPA: NAD(P)H-hydrate dehydratase [Burkholderiales bacterium]|nr:NAD(P)H-hydrate dehydratase [Burkholderiales bacterium]
MALHFAHNTPLYLTAEVRQIENAAAALPDSPPLMERAGLAAAELARKLADNAGKPVLVLAGPGNNGGDAFVIARHLRQWWFGVSVVFAGDERKLSADAMAALKAWRAAGGAITDAIPPNRDWGLIIDGLFGIGLQRDVAGRHAELIDAANNSGTPILAVDIPSGLESDTGRVLGRAVRAQHTVTFIGLKPGLLTLDGPDHCGEIHLCALGLDAPALLPAHGSLIGGQVVHAALRPRALNSHKGNFGSVGIIGGADGMVGAALLAGRAALKLGAGRIYVGLIANDAPSFDTSQPELMLRTADEVIKLDHLTCLAAGPGLGQSPDAFFYLGRTIESQLPLVIDADGLNLVAADMELKNKLKQRVIETLLTPHPAEAARLLNTTTRDIQHDRVTAANTIARELNCAVVLKGAGSICALPDRSWAINTSGNPGMASAGMGDVLTGIIAALLAQGADIKSALHAGVYLHGAAADALVAGGIGPAGLTASEVIDATRRLANAPE